MDLLEEVRKKAKMLGLTDQYPGLEAVVRHIEVAEQHLSSGRNGNDYLFSDVVYRTNQAFEGALKEAYTLLTGAPREGLTPYVIEKHFSESAILKQRVLSLFTNYRTEWRNKSTHDHLLSFSDQEAFLAIVTISAFVSILLDQMLERVACEQEKAHVANARYDFRGAVADYDSLTVAEQMIELMHEYAIDLQRASTDKDTEAQFLGRLAGFIGAVDPSVKVESNVTYKSGERVFELDAVISKGKNRIPIEIKRGGTEVMRRVRDGQEKLLIYMQIMGLQDGIVFVSPKGQGQEIKRDRRTLTRQGKQYTVTSIYPDVSTSGGTNT